MLFINYNVPTTCAFFQYLTLYSKHDKKTAQKWQLLCDTIKKLRHLLATIRRKILIEKWNGL